VSTIIGHFLRDERGATAIEYGLIAGILCIGVVGFVQPLSEVILIMYAMAVDGVTAAASTIP